MPNKKGGYKIVSLKNINLLGVSLSLAGLYKALNDSYGKPIQICDINFNGTKKKDAFVLVEKLDAGVKINDLYGYDILVESDDDITVTANPQELPATASATAGQILGLDADKKPEWQDKPASGTKLYKHVIAIDKSYAKTFKATLKGTENLTRTASDPSWESYDNPTVTIISTVSVASDIKTLLWDNKDEIIRAKFDTSSVNAIFLFSTATKGYFINMAVNSATATYDPTMVTERTIELSYSGLSGLSTVTAL